MNAARPWLLPLVPLYRLGLAISEVRPAPPRRLRWPVVSIGNLSTGGTGKTPLTIALAKALTARGLHVDVLSRGYGRRSRISARVDPNGTAEEFGDEPLVIAREAGVDVYLAAERFEAGLMAEAAQSAPAKPAVHLLDDGFQHRQLARDIDILLIDRRDWQDHLLPAGNLREPLKAALRANIFAIPADDSQFEAELRAWGWQGIIWRLLRRMEVPSVEVVPRGGPIAAFCGIARPEQFFQGLESAGLRVASRTVFPDHHRYVQHDLDCLLDAARNVGATALITTEKDQTRLGNFNTKLTADLPLKTAQLRVDIDNEPAAIDWLLARCSATRPPPKPT